ncbi:signal recognition particle-docking protein FtsY [Streptococcus parasanguinis]|uniref:signal recognition particle-docking protein FtsY n=1 Tax=Streptococcus parasanguinis TaxID=1318 RepID=UPI0012BBB9B1|nr:signal recognition particle-docking protein FtsY [Streptococcus parasanguinis]MDU4778821.1 signal recognition particle-docking protein FtsY [Streptococcus parasanguinis]MTR54067.1 signal recognition particle-docking protein FtsY [Streptococcus parasanguinis]MTR55420.1 signal recognition particle-docking protein FtsY [Streptococcus parasanguinis]MTR60244.1 signal recognition particle-docking protein FtsY [Streptococcus parasanguinis]MTR70789.1 signal recognition particle-docking protein FtsY
MGLFDRLFGKKEETEKVLPSSEEVTESTEVEETVKEEPAATLNGKEEQKIADMEAYYQELKARIAATHQPVSTVAQEEPAEEPLVEEKVTSETPEDQAPVEESPVAVEPAQTEANPQEVSPLADETETEPLEEVKIEAEETEIVGEADEIDVIDLEEESPIASPSPDAEPVEESTTEEESPELVEAQDEVSEPEVSEAIAQVEETSEVAEAESRLPEGEAASTVEERTVEEAEAPIPDEVEPEQETIQEKYDRSLKKTRTGFGARLNAFFANFRSVDEEFFEELEELLIMSDVGVQVASNLTEELRYEARLENAKKPDALKRVIIEKLVDLYEKDGQFNEAIRFQDGLTVMLFVGVNGVGKTTSIGKLAHRYKQEGKKVMLVAADTFRAGAVAQLAEWGRRVDVPVVTGPEKSDPASVVFDGMERAIAENIDVLMIDTAGRLQNKDNLMAELEKIGRIIKRVVPDAPHETLLALDASTGQNALVQAKEFSKITPVTGIVLTKIDGTARGGVVLAIREELDIPVKLIGFGEKIDDIGPFHSENFMRGLLEGLI